MKMERHYRRRVAQVHNDFPDIGETSSKREKALTELLRCLPDEDYSELKLRQHVSVDSKPRYTFFIVSKDTLGRVYPLYHLIKSEEVPAKSNDGFIEEFERKPSLIEVYLSPTLESMDFDHVLVVAAHELAHIFLNHQFFEESNEEEEIGAWEQVCKWGFREELEAYFEFRKQEEALTLILNPGKYPKMKGGEPA
jgi:hypothetical protein